MFLMLQIYFKQYYVKKTCLKHIKNMLKTTKHVLNCLKTVFFQPWYLFFYKVKFTKIHKLDDAFKVCMELPAED